MRKYTGLIPQLLTPITESEALALLSSPVWCMSEKMDGKHVMIEKIGSQIVAAQKQGLECWIPDAVAEAVRLVLGENDGVLDGELIGDTYHVFDILEYDGNCRAWVYQERYEHLIVPLIESAKISCLPHVECHFSEKKKSLFFSYAKRMRKEGVVFKRVDRPFTEGRPEFGGDMLKCKFWQSCSAIVDTEKTGKSSFISYVFDENGDKYFLGRCTVAGKPIPIAGTVVEIKYLYCYPDGKLIQSVYLGERDDIDMSECVKSQLKIKA